MDSSAFGLFDVATVAHAEPFHFCRYRSKSTLDEAASRQPWWVPETVDW